MTEQQFIGCKVHIRKDMDKCLKCSNVVSSTGQIRNLTIRERLRVITS